MTHLICKPKCKKMIPAEKVVLLNYTGKVVCALYFGSRGPWFACIRKTLSVYLMLIGR